MLEIAVITPLRAMMKPRIPTGVTCAINPPKRVTNPRRTSQDLPHSMGDH
jgi:hypothetical protein